MNLDLDAIEAEYMFLSDAKSWTIGNLVEEVRVLRERVATLELQLKTMTGNRDRGIQVNREALAKWAEDRERVEKLEGNIREALERYRAGKEISSTLRRALRDEGSELDPTCCFVCREKVTEGMDLLEAQLVPIAFAPCSCGNKRCPRSTHHDNDCTGSNDVGQPGSAWGAFPDGE